MSWLAIAKLLLQLTNNIMDWVQEKQLLDAGEDKAIAKASLAVLAKTQAGRDYLAKLQAMTDKQVDDVLAELET